MVLLSVDGISKLECGIVSVRDISFTQEPYQKIAIAGETGSGKTSLLKMIAGLIQPDTGQIIFESKRVLGPLEKLMPGHPGIGYLSQHFELRNNYFVEDELDAKNKLSAAESENIFSICRIQHLLKRKTDQLSGGERQRIALARVLISYPRLLLLDEPFSNLDMTHKQIMKSVIHDIGSSLGITCMMVLHDAPDILSWADSILVMKNGQLIQQGSPEQIYRQPLTEYCAGLFGAYNIVSNSESMAKITGMALNGKKIMVRPEDIQLSEYKDHAVEGTVLEVLYWGSFYSVDVLISDELIRLHVPKPNFEKGGKVYISIPGEAIWYL
jgi:ABC-type sulfate/molybdate transport systems ATPase subunit